MHDEITTRTISTWMKVQLATHTNLDAMFTFILQLLELKLASYMPERSPLSDGLHKNSGHHTLSMIRHFIVAISNIREFSIYQPLCPFQSQLPSTCILTEQQQT